MSCAINSELALSRAWALLATSDISIVTNTKNATFTIRSAIAIGCPLIEPTAALRTSLIGIVGHLLSSSTPFSSASIRAIASCSALVRAAMTVKGLGD